MHRSIPIGTAVQTLRTILRQMTKTKENHSHIIQGIGDFKFVVEGEYLVEGVVTGSSKVFSQRNDQNTSQDLSEKTDHGKPAQFL